MRLRVLVFEDNEGIASLLRELLTSRGYEVFAFPRPVLCQTCQQGHACADVIISDVAMPRFTGVEFIENQVRKGCKIEHVALMSGYWSESNLQKARQLGWQVFHEPFSINEMQRWLDDCEKNVDPNRVLSPWFLQEAYRQDIAELTNEGFLPRMPSGYHSNLSPPQSPAEQQQ